jgi:prephenate dehydratase
VESDDTAFSAKEISENGIKGRGALASRAAAELYGLEILRAGVETNKRNFTRFLILDPLNKQSDQAISKASWSFRTAHESGSLAKALTVLGTHGINLTKIQSLPVLGEEWKYYFYADLEFSDASAYRVAKEEVAPYIYDLRILGEYQQGEKYL